MGAHRRKSTEKKESSESQEIHLCGQCDLNFATSEELFQHLNTHDKLSDDIMCRKCGKTFKTTGGMFALFLGGGVPPLKCRST